MRKIFVNLLIVLTVVSCKGQTKERDSFEGIITYHITFTPKTDNVTYNAYQKQKYGDKLKLTVRKDGSFKREFLTSGNKGFDFYIYNSTSNKSFTKWRNIDTVYSSNCAENSLNFIGEKDLPDDNIKGQDRNGYFISGVSPKGQVVTLTYYYPKGKEFINPDLYRNDHDFFYDKVIQKIQAPFFKLIMDMGNYSVNFDLERIEGKAVGPAVTELPANIPVK